jgi:hypothetical protein
MQRRSEGGAAVAWAGLLGIEERPRSVKMCDGNATAVDGNAKLSLLEETFARDGR